MVQNLSQKRKSQYVKYGFEKKLSESHHLMRISRINAYLINPKLCKNCNLPIDYDKKKNVFCSRTCSGNFKQISKNKFLNKCKFCGNRTDDRNFCDNSCKEKFNSSKTIEQFKNNNFSNAKINNALRKYIFNKFENKCSECSWAKTNPKSGKIPLHIDHIDGNGFNHSKENLRLLCPNCHSLTPTYGSLNMGNGRKSIKANESLTTSPSRSKITKKNFCEVCHTSIGSTSKRCRSCSSSKISWPTTESVIELLKNSNFVKTAKKLGVTDNAVRKFLARNKIDQKTFCSTIDISKNLDYNS